MQCPKCGFEQSTTDTCVKCGVIVAKFLARNQTAQAVAEPASASDQTVTLRRGQKLIRNVRTKDLPDKIRAGEVFSSDELSQDEKKWVLLGMHPQLQPIFQQREIDQFAPADPDEEIRDPGQLEKLKRLNARYKNGKISRDEFEASRQAIIQKARKHNQAEAKKKVDRATLLGGIGAISLLLGLFLPLYKIPTLSGLNFLDKSYVESGILVILAFAALHDMSKGGFSMMKWLGFATLGFLIVTFFVFYIQLFRVKAGVEEELQTDFLNGLNQTGAGNVEFSWGWAVLALGAFLILVAGFVHSKSRPKQDQVSIT